MKLPFLPRLSLPSVVVLGLVLAIAADLVLQGIAGLDPYSAETRIRLGVVSIGVIKGAVMLALLALLAGVVHLVRRIARIPTP